MTRKMSYFVLGTALLISLGVTVLSVHVAQQSEREQAMLYELKTLRNVIELYVMEKKAHPHDIGDAIASTHRSTLQNVAPQMSSEGPLDPFGHPYQYNPNSGWVFSQTNGYRSW